MLHVLQARGAPNASALVHIKRTTSVYRLHTQQHNKVDFAETKREEDPKCWCETLLNWMIITRLLEKSYDKEQLQ